MRVAVVGASRVIGRPVLTALRAHGHDVTICSLRPALAAAQVPGVRAVPADFLDASSMTAAFSGCDAVISMLTVAAYERPYDAHALDTGLEAVLEAARAAHVGRVVHIDHGLLARPAATSAPDWERALADRAGERLSGGGIPWTWLRTSTIMETAGILAGRRRVFWIPTRQPRRRWFVAGADVGAAVATALTRADTTNRWFAVQGPHPFTWPEAAAVLAQGRRLRCIVPALATILGIQSDTCASAARWARREADADEDFVAQTTWALLGAPKITLVEFAGMLRTGSPLVGAPVSGAAAT